MTQKPKRPFGVTIIAVLLLLNGAIATTRITQIAYNFYQEQNGDIDPEEWEELTDDLTVFGWLALPLAACGIGMAWGMWTLQPRAWTLTMALQGIYLAAQLTDYIRGEPPYIDLLVSLATVFYLNQRDVQMIFRPHAARAHIKEAPDER